jgi:nickel-type superoxide dismutase maturation protease
MGELINLLLWLVGRRHRYRIVGRSMYPTLSPGDKVWVDLRAYTGSRPQEGEIVLVRHPYRTNLRMVKRVVRVLSDGRCLLSGDNAEESTDSRTFGAVPKAYVLGRVILRFPLKRKACAGRNRSLEGAQGFDIKRSTEKAVARGEGEVKDGAGVRVNTPSGESRHRRLLGKEEVET